MFIKMQKMTNAVQNYAWGSHDALTQLYGIANPQGQPMVFIHGLLGSRLNWEAQVASPALQKYRMITYDLRGHGLSGKPVEALAYSDGKRWADDLAAVADVRAEVFAVRLQDVQCARLVAVGGEVFPEVLERLHIADLELRRPPDHEPSRDFPGERNFHDVSSDPTTQSCGHGYCNSDSIAGPEEQ